MYSSSKFMNAPPDGFSALRKILFTWCIVGLGGCAAATQVVAWYYDYPPQFGAPLFATETVNLYQPLQFFLWALVYPTSLGVYLGWGVFFGAIVASSCISAAVWARRNLMSDSTKSLYGSSDWGDPNTPRFGLRQKHGLVLGKDEHGNFLVDNRNTHVMIAASTGSGKSAGPAVLTLLNYQESVIVADIKGELSGKTAGFRSRFSDIHIFNPLLKEGITRINPLLEVRMGINAIADCTVLANALIPPPQGKNADEHWVEKGREWVKSVLLYMLHCEKRENVHLGYVYQLISTGPKTPLTGFGAKMLTCEVPKHDDPKMDAQFREIEKYIRTTAGNIVSINDKEGSSIVSTISRHLEPFRNPDIIRAMKKSTFSLRDLIYAKRPQTLYLASPPGDMNLVSPIIRVIFEMTSRIIFEKEPRRADTGEKTTLMADEDKASLWHKITAPFRPAPPEGNGAQLWPKLKDRHNLMFLLDEAPRYGRLQAIEESISLIRSYGGRIVLIAQASSMLKRIYGKDSDIFVNCGVKLFLAVAELDEAKEVSAYVGITTRSYWSQGISKTPASFVPSGVNQNANFVQRSLINPDEVMQLSEAILIIEGLPPMKIKKAFYYEHSRFQEASEIKFSGQIKKDVVKFPWHSVVSSDSDETDEKGGNMPFGVAQSLNSQDEGGKHHDLDQTEEAPPSMTPMAQIRKEIPSQGGMQAVPVVEKSIADAARREQEIQASQINALVGQSEEILQGKSNGNGKDNGKPTPRPGGRLWSGDLSRRIPSARASAAEKQPAANSAGEGGENFPPPPPPAFYRGKTTTYGRKQGKL